MTGTNVIDQLERIRARWMATNQLRELMGEESLTYEEFIRKATDHAGMNAVIEDLTLSKHGYLSEKYFEATAMGYACKVISKKLSDGELRLAD